MSLFKYVLRLADNNLILGHRLSEWCGHGPFLEQDMAMTNIALDLMGQARSFYALAAEIESSGKTEDDLAFLRLEYEYENLLLAEQPNGDFAHTIVRQFFFSAYQLPYYQSMYVLLENTKDTHLFTLRGIIEKAIKEVTYHLRWSSEWVIRLGDGTEESKEKVQKAILNLFKYTGEVFMMDEVDRDAITSGYGIDTNRFAEDYHRRLHVVCEEAGLQLPLNEYMHTGGKQGNHTEYLGYILAEIQYMQRAYPNCNW